MSDDTTMPCILVYKDNSGAELVIESLIIGGFYKGRKYVFHSIRKSAPKFDIGGQQVDGTAEEVKWFYEEGHSSLNL